MMIKRWLEAVRNPLFTREVPVFLIFCLIMLYNSPKWMSIVESQQGVILPDPILNILPTLDLSYFIVLVIYGTVAISFAWLIFYPMQLLLVIKNFWLVVTLRYILIYIIPLEPHPDIIVLNDPFLAQFVYKNTVITKDLFFSGHMMIMCIACFITSYKPLKYVIIFLTVMMGFMLMIQHVHYSYDVLAAPIFTWGGYKLAQLNFLVNPFLQNSNIANDSEMTFKNKMHLTPSMEEM